MYTRKEPMYIVGISIITNNQDAVNYHTIAKLWENFLKNPIQNQISNITSPNIFCVYSDYENAYHANYRAAIGYAVKDLSSVPSQLTGVAIPIGNYREYLAASPEPQSVFNTWQLIWNTDPKVLNRSFIADFEEYQNNHVAIHIGCNQ